MNEPTVLALPDLIRVAIIEDQTDIREGLAFLIQATSGFSCTAAFRSMEEALARIGSDLPHVALVDIGLPGMSGIEGIRRLKETHTSLHLLMLTVYDDNERIFDALCAGASGYLLKKTAPARILECLKETLAGGAPMSPEVARRVIALFQTIRPVEREEYDLTPHEVRLLRLLVEGYNYKTAAIKLGVKVTTVAFHMRNIYDKLQVHSKSQAVSKALRKGIV